MALGVPAHRISVVRNTPEASRLLDFPEREHVEHGSLDVVYLGLLEKPRGLETVIKAVAVARASGNNVFLNVIGDGRERRAFESLANELGVMDTAVRFRGYIPYAEALQALSSADVGIVPHYANESWNTTIPNKLFDYMSAGLAVISSNARPAARVVRETDAGEVYDYTDPDDLARAFARVRDPQRRSDCASNGRAAVRDQYNWSVDGARLATAIDSLAKAVD
jgi:glycosyltransferase involved in cell wall biosynthesis